MQNRERIPTPRSASFIASMKNWPFLHDFLVNSSMRSCSILISHDPTLSPESEFTKTHLQLEKACPNIIILVLVMAPLRVCLELFLMDRESYRSSLTLTLELNGKDENWVTVHLNSESSSWHTSPFSKLSVSDNISFDFGQFAKPLLSVLLDLLWTNEKHWRG